MRLSLHARIRRALRNWPGPWLGMPVAWMDALVKKIAKLVREEKR